MRKTRYNGEIKLLDPDFNRNVFVNCPFDDQYKPILQAVLFCLVVLELKPRLATERSDAGEQRIIKIRELIASSRYSIHDLSRCEARYAGELSRLNMPFELGMDFGCRYYGGTRYSKKVILVLEEERYRYQKAISDLAGSDIEAHGGDYEAAVRIVRRWITEQNRSQKLGTRRIFSLYEDFQRWNYRRQLTAGYSDEDIAGAGSAQTRPRRMTAATIIGPSEKERSLPRRTGRTGRRGPWSFSREVVGDGSPDVDAPRPKHYLSVRRHGRSTHRWPLPGAAARVGAASTISYPYIRSPVRRRPGVLVRKNVRPAHRPPSISATMPIVPPLPVWTTLA